MAPIPPYVARVTETQRGVELHTTHGHELLTVSSRTKKARDFPETNPMRYRLAGSFSERFVVQVISPN